MPASRLVVGLASALLATALAWAGWVIVGGQQTAKTLAWARPEIEAGRYESTAAVLNRISRWCPRNPEVEYLLGKCEAKLGHFDEALAALNRVLPGSPQADAAELARGQAILKFRARLSVAEAAFRNVSEGNSTTAIDARWALGEILLTEGRHDELRQLLEEIGRVGKGRDRAVAMRELWRLDSVIVTAEDLKPTLDTALRENTEDTGIWLARAHLETQRGRYPEARAWLERYRDQAGTDSVVTRATLNWAIAAGNLAEAERAAAELKASELPTAERWRLAAWLAQKRTDRPAERATLEQLMAADPSDTPSLSRLAASLVELGETRKADDARRLLDQRLRQRKQYRDLLIAASDPIPRDELRTRADLAEGLKRWVEARNWTLLILERAPGDREALKALERVARAQQAEREREPNGNALAALSALEWIRHETGLKANERALSGEISSPKTIATNLAETAGTTVNFHQAATASGLTFRYQNGATPERQIPETIGGGVAVLDFDKDGWFDVFLVQGGRFPPLEGSASMGHDPSLPGDRLFRNRGDGRFEDVTASSRIGMMKRGYGFGVTAADYDGDGDTDLFVTRFGSYQLLSNRGDGTFEDATERSGLGGDRDWPTSAAFADLDADGDLDLYVCHYLKWDAAHPTVCHDSRAVDRVASCVPLGFPAEADHLFRNDGGRFVDVSAEAGITDSDGRGLGVVATDLDQDGRIDIFVANDMSANFYFHNLGGMKFEESAHRAGLACNADGNYQAGMGIACGDLDADGRPDLAVTNFLGESTTFYRNMGHGLFSDATTAVGLKAPSRLLLGFGAIFLDVNNDGFLDLATANGHVQDLRPSVAYAMPAQLLLGNASGILTDVTRASGELGRDAWVGRGLAQADFDNDGRIDLLLVGQNEPVAYFHNDSPDVGHFLTLRLQGSGSNRDANGAVVSISSGLRKQVAWRFGGGSYASAGDPRLHFGTGAAVQADRVEVRWMSGAVSRFDKLPTDRAYLIREGSADIQPLAGVPSQKAAPRPVRSGP